MGKHLGLEKIYREHYTFVWRILRRMGAFDVDDAVQEVFVVMHRRGDELDVSDSVRPLLYGIARKVAAQQRRKANREPPPLALVAKAAPDPEQSVAQAEAAQVVRDALDAMDDDKRMIFLLADVEGMSIPEVARCHGVNLNTAYARLRAARVLVERAVQRHRAREEGSRVRARVHR
ncbi:MAG: sigma-70 family RNA polymerase sigma factor [Deltaproteobacteria bacterium]|nr:sigma-70 family RNA polymerase sigma factor [Deltaproteobacteria bacterium]